MYHEVKIPLQDLLNEELTGQSLTVRDLIVDKAMNKMTLDESVSIEDLNLAKPVIIARDAEIVVHFYPVPQVGVDDD